MTRDEAAKLLGFVELAPLPTDIGRGIITTAWRKLVRQYHADTSAAGTSDATMIAKLTEARDLLLQTGPAPCTSCKGVGKVRRRFGSVDCGACKGTGDKNGR